MAWREFLRWWGEQLAEWLPAGLRRRLERQQRVLRVDLGAEGARISLRHGGKEQPLGELPGLDAEGLLDALQGRAGLERVELRLPPGQYLARNVELPLAAAADLQQAIGYQVETLTPFKRDQLWLFCGEEQRLPDGKRLRAWLVAVPRRAGQVLEQLNLAVGSAPERGPRRAPAPDEAVLLGFRPGHSGRRAVPLGWLLVVLNLGALLLAAGLHLDNRQDELTLLQSQARALQQDAIAASDLAGQVEQLQARLDALQRQRSAHPTRVEVLEELSRRLDEHTWLRRLELRAQQLRMQGNSHNASALIAALDDSPLFSEVRFEAALTRDPVAGAERFNLTAEVGRMPTAALAAQDTQP
jgi:general secretion pathway protein L